MPAIVLRVLFNIMYTMVETFRWPNDNDSDEWKRLRENFRIDLRECDAVIEQNVSLCFYCQQVVYTMFT